MAFLRRNLTSVLRISVSAALYVGINESIMDVNDFCDGGTTGSGGKTGALAVRVLGSDEYGGALVFGVEDGGELEVEDEGAWLKAITTKIIVAMIATNTTNPSRFPP
jgi:hypothetical protein